MTYAIKENLTECAICGCDDFSLQSQTSSPSPSYCICKKYNIIRCTFNFTLAVQLSKNNQTFQDYLCTIKGAARLESVVNKSERAGILNFVHDDFVTCSSD